MTRKKQIHLGSLCTALVLLTTLSSFAMDGDSDEDDNCPCSLAARQINYRGKAVGSGNNFMVSVTGLTWEQTSTKVETTSHEAKTKLELIAGVIPQVSGAYKFTLAHQTLFKRDNIRNKIIVEYTDFTTNANAGRCYSYYEEPLCEDRTERNCTASLSCKVNFKNGRGNLTTLDIGSYETSQPSSSTTNLGSIHLERRFPKPGGPPFPLNINHDLECGDSSYKYITSFQWSLNPRNRKVSIHPDFGYSAVCGECPKEYEESDQ